MLFVGVLALVVLWPVLSPMIGAGIFVIRAFLVLIVVLLVAQHFGVEHQVAAVIIAFFNGLHWLFHGVLGLP
jgi:hypothetical protein